MISAEAAALITELCAEARAYGVIKQEYYEATALACAALINQGKNGANAITRCDEPRNETIITSLYDIEEIHPNCTVQILRNSFTGEESVGWWENVPEDTENEV